MGGSESLEMGRTRPPTEKDVAGAGVTCWGAAVGGQARETLGLEPTGLGLPGPPKHLAHRPLERGLGEA